MCVVDRREDESAYAPGANRAEVQAELERLDYDKRGSWESSALPAQVEVENFVEEKSQSGVLCVTETPGGPKALLKLLLARVWGYKAI